MSFQQYPFKGGIPSGTSANRPGSPAIGDTYYNGELGLLEIYTSSGWQPSSAPSGTPTIVVTDLGTSRAYTDGPAFKIDFTASNLGGFPVGYTVTATTTVTSSVYSGVTSTGTTITVATFSGATGYGASYTVNGASYNGFGASPYQNGGVTVTTKPQVPTIGTAYINDTSTTGVTVTWTNGANGGSPLTSIKVRAYSGTTLISTTTAATTSSTSATITGLNTATAYTFKVFATNANGDSPESSASNSVTIFNDVSYLIVAGGGGGASIIGGGGGAGGVRKFTSQYLGTNRAYPITVGAGGRGGSGYSSNVSNESGYPGWDSVFNLMSSSGGGGAIGWTGHGSTPSYSGQRTWSRNGGSGAGGSANNSTTTGVRGTGNLGGYSPVEGYNGGDGDSDTKGLGGGGGGASAAGTTSTTGTSTNGGAGLADSITGSSVTYGGGGAGGRRRSFNGGGGTSGTWSYGGAGGGGSVNGSDTGFNSGQNGTANTGGGGASGNYEGTGDPGQAGGNGGSGVVIIRIPNTYSATFSGGVTSSLSTSVTGYKIYTVTAAGTSDTVTFS